MHISEDLEGIKLKINSRRKYRMTRGVTDKQETPTGKVSVDNYLTGNTKI